MQRVLSKTDIVTNPSEDLECRIQCPCCLGTKTTSDFQGVWNCAWCWSLGSVPPRIWDLYWAVRASSQYASRRSFGDRVVLEVSEKNQPYELLQFQQRMLVPTEEYKKK